MAVHLRSETTSMDCFGSYRNHQHMLLTFILSQLARFDVAFSYLYLDASSAPIVEYLPGTEKDPENPSFIFGPNNNNPRVLEFYGNHCPYCNEFHKPYISFAHEITNLTNETGLGPVEVYGINCGVHANLCSKFGVTSVPSVHLLAAGATSTTFEISKKRMHPFIILNRLAVEKDTLVLGNDKMKQNIYNDAYLSFLWTLRKQIFKQQGQLSRTQKKALKDWLELLKMALPPEWKIRRIINDILNEFKQVVNGEEYLLSILDKHWTPDHKWSEECEKDPEGSYQCGLWSLMYIVVVGVFEFNYLLDSFMAPDIPIPAARAAKAIQSFVSTFLDCEKNCNVNLLAGYDPCGNGRCEKLKKGVGEMLDWLQVSIWWLETRQAVKSKLTGSSKRAWPAHNDCPACWRQDGSMDEKALYKYLRIMYWPDDSKTDKYRKELGMSQATSSMNRPMNRHGTELILPLRVEQRVLQSSQKRWSRGTKSRVRLMALTLSLVLIGAWGRRLRMRYLKRKYSK